MHVALTDLSHLSGASLADGLAHAGVLDPFQTLAILEALCRELQSRHDAGEGARLYLEPKHLEITGDGHLRLLDTTDAADPERMAPEQRARLPVDGRTDQWHLGVLASHLLLGVRKLAPTAVPPPPRLAQDLGDVIRRLLAPEPADRFGSALQAAAALREAVSHLSPLRCIALDLEGTLLTTAYDPLPRPYLREFAEWCLETFDRVFIYTAVQENTAQVIIARFVRAGVLPPDFPQRTEMVIWPRGAGGIRKDLRHLRLPLHWVVLLDDMPEWVVESQRHRWVQIVPFAKPIAGDEELNNIRPEILRHFE